MRSIDSTRAAAVDDPLARVVRNQTRLDQVQFQAGPAPGHAIQPPQPIFDGSHEQLFAKHADGGC